MKQGSGFAPTLIILVVAAVLALGGGFLYYTKQRSTTPVAKPSAPEQPVSSRAISQLPPTPSLSPSAAVSTTTVQKELATIPPLEFNGTGSVYPFVGPGGNNFVVLIGAIDMIKSPSQFQKPISTYAIINGKQTPSYDALGTTVNFSADGSKYAYLAERSGKVFAVVNGEEGRPYDFINEFNGVTGPLLSPDGSRIFYLACNYPGSGEKCYKVINGQEEPILDKGSGYSFRFSQDGSKSAYISARGHGDVVMIINGQSGKSYNTVFTPLFSDDGSTLVYGAIKEAVLGEKLVVVANENEVYERVRGSSTFLDMAVSPDGKNIAYKISVSSKTNILSTDEVVIYNGKEGKQYDQVQGWAFSPDSNHFSYTAVKNNGRGCFLIVDQKETEVNNCSGIHRPAFSPDGKFVVFATEPLYKPAFMMLANVGSLAMVKIDSYNGNIIREPEFSSDGKYVTYAVDNQNLRSDSHKLIWVVKPLENQ